MTYPLESALFQWQEGWRTLEGLAGDQARYRHANRFVDSVRDELRRRVGSTFTMAELADFYGRGTDWCLRLAAEVAPRVATEAQSLADAAFWLHLRVAADFSGGRTLVV
jgi:hypothetical protein